MTYGELAALTNRIAHVLVEDMKLVPGNRLLLRGPNNPMMAAPWLAAIKAGLVTVPTMPLLRAKELKQIIDKAQIQALCDVRLKDEAEFCLQKDHEHHCAGLRQVVFQRPGAGLAGRAGRDQGRRFPGLRHLGRRRLPDRLHQRHHRRAQGLHALPSRRAGHVRPVSQARDQAGTGRCVLRHAAAAFTFGLGGLLCFRCAWAPARCWPRSCRPTACCS